MLWMPPLDDDAPEPGQGGERAPGQPGESRRLSEPPSSRYAPRPTADHGVGDAPRSTLRGPLLRASAVAIGGAALLTLVGAVLASTAGLLFAAGITGAAIGLVLARAAVPLGEASPVPRGRVARIAVGLSLAAVLIASLAAWVIARGEGGVLGPIDYLLTTFGPFIPAEAAIAAVAAWWGASVGPVQS